MTPGGDVSPGRVLPRNREVVDHASLYDRDDHHYSSHPLAVGLAGGSGRREPGPPVARRDPGGGGDQAPAGAEPPGLTLGGWPAPPSVPLSPRPAELAITGHDTPFQTFH